MASPIAPSIKLTVRQKKHLEQLIRRRKTSQQLVYRAKIILEANTNTTNEKIGEKLEINRLTVGTWRRRWSFAANRLAEIEEDVDDKTLYREITHVLSDASRSGSQPRFTANQICQILAVAVRPPSDFGRPVSHWSSRELAMEVIDKGIVESISARHVRRFLKSGGVETPSQSLLA